MIALDHYAETLLIDQSRAQREALAQLERKLTMTESTGLNAELQCAHCGRDFAAADALAETPRCESCGEDAAEIRLEHAGLCGDCFARDMSTVIHESTGDLFCCHPLFVNGKLAAMCMMPHGVEHAHGKIECMVVA